MKASELIYRLAKAIQERGDIPVTVTIVDADGRTIENVEIKCLDVYPESNSYSFEIYGEE